MECYKKNRKLKIKENEIAIIWLGQAGFLIKDHSGYSIAIDPYLTDSCERLVGFKRLMPGLMSPKQLKVDLLLATHHHEDHLDVDAVPTIMKDSKTKLVASVTAAKICKGMGIDNKRLTALSAGDNIKVDKVNIKAVYADHGDLAPDALGFIIDVSGIRIYFTGDTGYTPERMQEAIKCKPDILILPINGAYGNLGSEEAMKLTKDVCPSVAIPCHFWTFIEHGGNPQQFADTMKSNNLQDKIKFMTQGEIFYFKK